MAGGTVIVTGASKGIGAAVAAELDRRGLKVAGLSRSGQTPAGRGLVCDMTDDARVRDVFAEIADGGSITGLVNNAGFHDDTPSAGLATERYEMVMRLNATALMVACREAYPHLVRSGGGKIVNMGSFFDRLGVPGNLAYCASKAAVAAITRCLAVEWAAEGITVVCVAPGYIETGMNREVRGDGKGRAWLEKRIPMGRAGTPEEVATLVGSLIAEDMPFLTGETIYLDGGQGIKL